MKFSGVIVRFISLLDITLILLGVFMLALMQTTLTKTPIKGGGEEATTVVDQVNIIYLYAGWKGEQEGKCYLLDEKMKVDRTISTAAKDDIQAVVKARRGESKSNDLVMLLFDADGWFDSWPDKKLGELENNWGVKVVPIYNIKIQQ